MGTVIVGAVLVGIVVAILCGMRKSRKNGKHSYGIADHCIVYFCTSVTSVKSLH